MRRSPDLSLRTSAHAGVAIRISRRPASILHNVRNKRRQGGEKTDCHNSDVGHCLAMTSGNLGRRTMPSPSAARLQPKWGASCAHDLCRAVAAASRRNGGSPLTTQNSRLTTVKRPLSVASRQLSLARESQGGPLGASAPTGVGRTVLL